MKEKVIEHKMGWHKFLISLLSAIAISSGGWFAGNYETAHLFFVFNSVVAFFVSFMGIPICVYKFRYYLKKLGEL